jgi:hypothetical protein
MLVKLCLTKAGPEAPFVFCDITGKEDEAPFHRYFVASLHPLSGTEPNGLYTHTVIVGLVSETLMQGYA